MERNAMRSILLTLLLITMITFAFNTRKVSAPIPSTYAYQSQALADSSSGITVTDPAKAHDRTGECNFTFAQFDYTTTGSFEVKNFIIPDSYPTWAPNIIQVDLKMKYNTTVSSTDDKYRIVYYVAPSTDAQVLKDYSRDATPLDTYVWSNLSEPNDGVWSWADIAAIRFVVETLRVGVEDSSGTFQEYQAWVTVLMPSTAKFFVEPASTFADPNEFFTVNITVNNIVDLYAFEFHLSWDPAVLNITSVVHGPFGGGWVWKNQSWWYKPAIGEDPLSGELWFAGLTVPLGTRMGEGKSGSGTLLIMTFVVKSQGITPLDLWDIILVNSNSQGIPSDVVDGVFGLPSPVARFSYSPTFPYVGQAVAFDASDSSDPHGTIVSQAWDFGDGFTGTGVVATHIYQNAGPFTVTLTVTDNDGLTDSLQQSITADPLPTLTVTKIHIKSGFTETIVLELIDDDYDGVIVQDIPNNLLAVIRRTHDTTTFDFSGEYTVTKGAWTVMMSSRNDYTVTLT